MPNYSTTDTLLTSLKARILAPVGNATFDDTTLLQMLNEEQEMSLVPEIMKVREDFFLDSITRSIVGSVPTIQLPERAMGNALKSVWFVDNGGNKRRLTRRDVSEYATLNTTNSLPDSYYIQGDELVLWPTPSSSGTGSIQLWYYSRRNQLVKTANVARVTSISSVGGTTTFTVDTDLTGSLSVGSYVDCLSGKSPFALWAQDVPVTAITSTTVAVATSRVSDPSGAVEPIVGDYICPAQTCNIPMVPQEWHTVLVLQTACVVLEALGHLDKLERAEKTLTRAIMNAKALIENRVESDPERAVNPTSLVNNIGRSINAGVYSGR